MIGRLFFITALFLLGWVAFRYFRTQTMQKEQKAIKNSSSNTDNNDIEDVLPCALCGTHVAKDEMLGKGKNYFCSYQHLIDFDEQA